MLGPLHPLLTISPLSPQRKRTDGHPASRQGPGGGAGWATASAAGGEPADRGPLVMRHDFSSSGGSSGSSGKGAAAVPARSSSFSSSNKTGLTRDDMRRVSAALEKAGRRHKGDTIHTLFTSNGSPYQNIQGRIMWV
jgi:hypothetical protein